MQTIRILSIWYDKFNIYLYSLYITIGAVANSGGYSKSIWPHNIIDLNCTGNEFVFLNCSQNGLIDYSCPDSAYASIACQSQYITNNCYLM